MKDECPIWGTFAAIKPIENGMFEVNSERAGGKYLISEDLVANLSEGETLSEHDRQQLTQAIIEDVKQNKNLSVTGGTLEKLRDKKLRIRIPTSQDERKKQLLDYLIKRSKSVGDKLEFMPTVIMNENDLGIRIIVSKYNSLLAWSASTKETEVEYFLESMKKEGWIKVKNGSSLAITVTSKGYDALQATAQKAPKATEQTKVIKEHCNTCGPDKKHQIIKSYDNNFYAEDGTNGHDIWDMLECGGCEAVTLVRRVYFSEWQHMGFPLCTEDTYYPPRNLGTRTKPNWYAQFDNLSELQGHFILAAYNEVYELLQTGHYISAMLAARALLETIAIEQVGDKNTFAKKLNALVNKGFILERQKTILNEQIFDAGSAAMHRQYQPDPEDVGAVMDVIEKLIHTIYIEPITGDELNSKKPKRNSSNNKTS